MKKTILFSFSLLLALGLTAQVRYLEEVFTNTTVTENVNYGQNISVLTGVPDTQQLMMDVYEPMGDASTSRYLMILAHPGSFLPKGINTLPFGNRKDSNIVEMCQQFARRGWTAAAIDYRLGWNPVAATEEERARGIIQAVYRAMIDMKTAVRFFRDDATGANTFNIDPNKVAVGGSNSGGYMALATSSLNKNSELTLLKFLDGNGDPFVDVNTLGDFDGFGGIPQLNIENYPGISSDPQVVLNMGGASGDSTWHEAGEVPIVNFHGIADPLTPYNTAVVIVASTQQPVVEVSGSRDVAARNNRLGNHDLWLNDPILPVLELTQIAQQRTSDEGLFPFPGLINGFEPWSWYDPNDPNIDNTTPGATGFGSAANPFATKAKALAYIDTIMGFFSPRAILAMGDTLPSFLSVNDPVINNSSVNVYPNPAQDQLTIEAKDGGQINEVRVMDLTGRTLRNERGALGNVYRMDRGELPDGIYLITLEVDGARLNKKVIFN